MGALSGGGQAAAVNHGRWRVVRTPLTPARHTLCTPCTPAPRRLQHELSGVVQRYAGHLATQEAALTLVPLLMCHLPAAGRQALLVTLLCTAMGAWRDNVDRQQARVDAQRFGRMRVAHRQRAGTRLLSLGALSMCVCAHCC